MHVRGVVVTALSSVISVVAACVLDEHGTAPTDASVQDVSADNGCTTPLTSCGALCVDVATDVHNCGSCGIDCTTMGAGAACVNGKCQTCSTDTSTDPNNCGGCGHDCA